MAKSAQTKGFMLHIVSLSNMRSVHDKLKEQEAQYHKH